MINPSLNPRPPGPLYSRASVTADASHCNSQIDQSFPNIYYIKAHPWFLTRESLLTRQGKAGGAVVREQCFVVVGLAAAADLCHEPCVLARTFSSNLEGGMSGRCPLSARRSCSLSLRLHSDSLPSLNLCNASPKLHIHCPIGAPFWLPGHVRAS